jgi:hypothetical protein
MGIKLYGRDLHIENTLFLTPGDITSTDVNWGGYEKKEVKKGRNVRGKRKIQV